MSEAIERIATSGKLDAAAIRALRAGGEVDFILLSLEDSLGETPSHAQLTRHGETAVTYSLHGTADDVIDFLRDNLDRIEAVEASRFPGVMPK